MSGYWTNPRFKWLPWWIFAGQRRSIIVNELPPPLKVKIVCWLFFGWRWIDRSAP